MSLLSPPHERPKEPEVRPGGTRPFAARSPEGPRARRVQRRGPSGARRVAGYAIHAPRPQGRPRADADLLHLEREADAPGGRAAPHPPRRAARAARPHRPEGGLRPRLVRRLHRAPRREAGERLHGPRPRLRGARPPHDRGDRHSREARPRAARVLRGRRAAVRLLHAGNGDLGLRPASPPSRADPRPGPRGVRREPLPLRDLPEGVRGGAARGAREEGLMPRRKVEKGTFGFEGRPTEVKVEIEADRPRPWDLGTKLSVAGTAVPRVDGTAMTTGRPNDTVGVRLPGMLYGAVLRSTHPLAKVVSIDAAGARVMPGVRAVKTYEGKTVKCAGDEVAAVAAITPE